MKERERRTQTEQERIPISREQFIIELIGSVELLKIHKKRTKERIDEVMAVWRKVYIAEGLGMKCYFYETPDGVYFEARKKGRFGFRASVASKDENVCQMEEKQE